MSTGDPEWSTGIYDRKVGFIQPFNSLINSVELTKVKGEKSFLELSFTGEYLCDAVLDLYHFEFNFPFGKNKENSKIKKILMGKNIERLVIQQKYEDSLVAILDHGINLLLVTQFGECEKIFLI